MGSKQSRRAADRCMTSEVVEQLDDIHRELRESLENLGVMPVLRESAASLPDARSRLDYIAHKTGEAADKVLTSTEAAQQEQALVRAAIADLRAGLTGACGKQACRTGSEATLARHQATALLDRLDAATDRIDGHLTDMVLAQDFHDLTGQVIRQIVALALTVEDGLGRLLASVSDDAGGQHAAETAAEARPGGLEGPVVDPAAEGVVTSQSEVDDLLAGMGF